MTRAAPAAGIVAGHVSRGPAVAPEQPSASFFADALNAALMLVQADGGELATVRAADHMLVVQARARHRPSAVAPDLGHAVRNHPSFPPGTHERETPPTFPTDHDDVELQNTSVLTSVGGKQEYRPGEGLIGRTWQLGSPVRISAEELHARGAAGATVGSAGEGAWYLAVPIVASSSLAAPAVSGDVIGVLAVYRRDPRWSFSAQDSVLLQLHADRVARALSQEVLARQNRSTAAVLDLLRGAPSLSALYPRVRDVVHGVIDAPDFAMAVVPFQTPTEEAVTFELVERGGQRVAGGSCAQSQLPAWWTDVRAGRVVCQSATPGQAQDGADLRLGWGGEHPVASLLAIPLLSSSALLGVMVAGSPRPNAYSVEQVKQLETIASATAIMLEKAHLTHQLAQLNNAFLTLNASLDVETTAAALVRQAALFTNAQARMVFLLDQSSGVLKARATSWTPPQAPSIPLDQVVLPLDWQNLGEILRDQPYALLDGLESDWQDGSALGALLAHYQIRSCLVVPMERADRTERMPASGSDRDPRAVGLLLVYDPGRRHRFRASEIGLLQALASQAAIAITNATLYEDLATAYEQQKELDRLKDEFVLTVSHEFRTPLTAIDGYVTLITRHGQRLQQEKLDQYAQEIRQATEHLTSMIGTLADVNRMATEPLQLRPVAVNAYAAAHKALAAQNPSAQSRVSLDVPDDLYVLADEERLPRIFSNLIGNAVKYTSDECRVVARLTDRATLLREAATRQQPMTLEATAPDGAWAVLGVRDFGPGIAPDDQTRLFQKFVRLAQSLTTPVRGTGLGLWICRQYVRALGGEIWVESELGEGALFEFCLRVAPAVSSHGA